MNIDFLLDRIKKSSSDIAFVTNDISYTYNDLLKQYSLAKEILLENNIEKGSIVALIGEFSVETIGMMLAIIENGNTYVPIANNTKNIKRYLEIAEVNYLIKENKVEVLNENINPNNELLKKLKKEKRSGFILFSSGTTGDPKAAVHDIKNLMEKYKVIGKNIRSIAFLLFDHIGGFNTVLYSISNGGLLVTLNKRTPEEVAKAIEKYKIELLPTSPSFINMILFSRIYEKYDISSLKTITYGTEPMPESTLKTFNKLFPNINLKQTYGLSEVGIIRTKSEKSDSLWMKIGGDENHQIKIVNDILYIKSKMSMIGYLNAPSPFDKDGWMNTKDKVEQKNGYIKILGRESEIINIGGEKVYPLEIESVILEIEDIKDVIVSSEKNSILGNIVNCTVYVDESKDKKEIKKQIKRYCSTKLEKYKIPLKIYFSDKPFNSTRFKRKR